MPSIERGPYEPPPDDHRVYDAAEEDGDDEGSRLPLLIVIALLVLAAFGGVVWLAYSQGVARGRTDTPQMIAAQPGPVKTAPTGDNAAPSSQIRGLKIYGNPAPNDDQVSDTGSTTPSDASAPPPATETPADTAPPKPAITKPAAVPALKKPADEGADVVPTAPPPATVTRPPANTVTAAALPPPATAAKPSGSGGIMLQIGAYKSEGEASGAWTTYKGKHSGALGGHGSDTKQVDLGAKGTWYRLRIGPFATRAEALATCDKLKADGGACFLAH
ncbi:MAG TPA: SPOR domain-containing protein [Rhizomicrobium sp.]|jgi:cell division protein FtsN|nr:SPOR domain-containing protein [Rhizomicrobium sp.]